MTSRLRIIVLGYIIRGPIGGMAWHQLQYVAGLARLGHDVLFLEDSDDYPSCYDPSTNEISNDPSYGLQFAANAFERLGIGERWGYYDAHRRRWVGPAADHALQSCRMADLLINVSGVNPIRTWLEQIPVRILIDTDPVFTQVRNLTDSAAMGRTAHHTVFFSFGESIESGTSSIPADGFHWQATRQPIVLDLWPVIAPKAAAYTTVMQWDSYPPTEYDGYHFGMKSQSFDLVRDLPSRTAAQLEMALGSASAPRDELRRLGWRLVDPLAVTRDPWTYQQYLQGSRGEFSVAKQGYVASRSGWFSERTACYLASGRPAVVQDTGFGNHIPCGDGLFAFHDTVSAVKAITYVEADYRRHCEAARDLAATHFDSQQVLTSLIERAFHVTAGNSETRLTP